VETKEHQVLFVLLSMTREQDQKLQNSQDLVDSEELQLTPQVQQMHLLVDPVVPLEQVHHQELTQTQVDSHSEEVHSEEQEVVPEEQEAQEEQVAQEE